MQGRVLLVAALLAVVGCGAVASLDRNAGDGPATPGGLPQAGTPVLSYRWRAPLQVGGAVYRPQEFAEPAVAESRFAGRVVYVGSHGGRFLCLRAADGKVLWEQQIGSVSSQAIVLDNLVYVGTDDGTLVAMDVATGQRRWRYETHGGIQHAPILVGDMVVFSNEEDRVIAVDRTNGKWRWEYKRDRPEDFTVRGHSGVAADATRVYAGFSDGHVVAIDATTGDPAWVRSLAGTSTQFVDVDSVPVLDGGVLYAASTAGGLYALDPADGTEKWRVAVAGAGTVSVDGARLYFAAADEGLFAVDREGHIVWRQGLAGAGDPARPYVSGRYVFQSVSERGMFIVDKETGLLFQVFDPGNGVSAAPAVTDESLYVLSNGGTLYAFDVSR